MKLACLALLSIGLTTSFAQVHNLDVSTATYLGGSQNDHAATSINGVITAENEVDIDANGNIVYVGKIIGFNPGGKTPVNLLGGGDGVIVRLNSTGTSVLSVTRLGTQVSDIQMAPNGNMIVAAVGIGPVMLNSTASSVLWSHAQTNIRRVAVGSDGTVASLNDSQEIFVFDGSGNQIGYRKESNRLTSDVAVDGVIKSVFITGFNNKNSPKPCSGHSVCPVQVTFIRSFNYAMTTKKWTAYDWPADKLDGDSADQNGMADTRGYRIAMGRDGKLYYAGISHGGNITYNYPSHVFSTTHLGSPTITQPDGLYNLGSAHITFYGRYNPVNGQVERGQYFVPRASSTAAVTTRPRGISADENGRVYITGDTGNSIKDRQLKTVDGIAVAPYSGTETFLIVTNPDFSAREYLHVFSAAGTHSSTGHAIASRNGLVAMTAMTANTTTRWITASNAVQPNNAGGSDGYLVVWGSGAGGPVNVEPSVALTAPGNNATYTAPASVVLTATASDSDGSISKVEFFSTGSQLLGADTSSPYTLTWNNVAAGNYSLTAKATDNGGAISTSSSVNVSVIASSSSSSSGGGGNVLNPIADTYVRDGVYVNSVFGTSTTLQTKSSASVDVNRQAFLKFDISSIPSSVSSAKLRVYGKASQSSSATAVHAYGCTNDSWTESGTNWNNKPATSGSSLSSLTVLNTAYEWKEFTVTSFINSEKAAGQTQATIVLKHDLHCTPNNDFHSREASSNKPELVIVP